ncbi:MAG: amino acid adenylation domain-containing protein [Thermoanaerobaculia bacterium]
MFEAVWFDPGRLLLVIHHLAVDGVSWRILIDDLIAAWNGAELEPEGVPFRVWAQHLAEQESLEELPVRGAPLIEGAVLDPQRDTFATADSLTIELPAALTNALLTTVPAAFHARINDVLLTALGTAAGHPVLIDLEGHGRESDRFDLSRTVGWFTTVSPVIVDAGGIKRVKEQLRAIQPRQQFASHERPQIGFNYLGRFGASANGDWSAVDESLLGSGANDDMPLFHLLEINAQVVDERLSATWTWARAHLSEQQVRKLAESWRDALEALARDVARGAHGHTPSDFPLVALSQQEVDDIEAAYPSLENILPLSPLQEGLVFHALYDRSAPDVYTVQVAIELGAIDVGRLRAAAHALLQRHANLRAAILRNVQVILREVELPWREVDASFDLAADRTERFTLTQAPLLRFTLVRREADRHLLLFTTHHVLLDGWSMPIVLGELFALYENGADLDALPRVTPYADYLSWLARQDHDAALAQWRHALAGIEEPTRLVPPAIHPQAPERWETHVDAALTAQLQELARAHRVTLNTVVQGLWAVLLGRLTGRDDVVFGVTVSGRPAELPGVEQMVGLFINTLPLRVRLHPAIDFATLLARIQDEQSSLMAVQHVGLAEIQKAAGSAELFDTLVIFENYPLDRAALGERRVNGLQVLAAEGRDATHYPLALMVMPGEQLSLRLDYDPSRFKRETAQSIGARFVALIKAAAVDAHTPLHRLDPERAPMQAVTRDVSRATLPDLFEAQAARTPHAIAVVCGETSLTYAQLNARANRVAHHLMTRGVGPDDIVGIALERSTEMLIALLGVMKAGAAYLPLDPEFPHARLDAMIEDAKPALVLDVVIPSVSRGTWVDGRQNAHATHVAPPHHPGPPTHARDDSDNPHRTLLSRHAAYVIYTSGSTGKPKGVVIEHEALSVFLDAMKDRVAFAPGHRHIAVTTMAFDISIVELFLPLCHGAEVWIASRDEARDPARLAALIRTSGAHSLQATPSHWDLLLQHDPDCLGALHVYAGGEALPVDLARALYARGRSVTNLYGPTEATVWASAHSLTDADVAEHASGAVVLGQPFPNYRMYVLDSGLRPAPIGVPGELYIAGSALARGYHERPSLSASRFVADPYSSEPGARMYLTGDLARLRADGTIEFLGRADQQLKIRGFRIEPGEIEAALTALPSIAQAAVIEREKRLVAYLVPADGAIPDVAELRAALAERLPEFMIPSAFVTLDALPLTPNRKLDRRALPAPEARARELRAARTAEEQILCELFAEVLSLERIGIDDNFFELGGHSITAARLVSRVRSALDVELEIRTLFEAPTVAELSRRLELRSAPASDPLLPIRARGELPPLFCIHPVSGLSWSYASLMRALDPDRPIYGLQVIDGALLSSVDAVAANYLERIRAVQPEGPYHLLGWSFGGLVAQAMAVQLRRAGADVGLVALLDSYPAAGEWVEPNDDQLRAWRAELPEPMLHIAEHNARLMHSFKPARYRGDVLLFIAAAENHGLSRDAWAPYVDGRIETHEIACGHHDMMQPAAAAKIASILEQHLRPGSLLPS